MRERLSMRLCAIVLTACRRLQEWQAVDVGARDATSALVGYGTFNSSCLPL